MKPTCDVCGVELETYPYKIDSVILCSKCLDEWGRGIDSACERCGNKGTELHINGLCPDCVLATGDDL